MKIKHYVLASLVTLFICPTILQLVILLFIAKATIDFESLLGIIFFMIFTLPPLVIIGIPASKGINLITKRLKKAILLFEPSMYLVFSIFGVIVTFFVLSDGNNLRELFDVDNTLIISYGLLCAVTFQFPLRFFSRRLH